MLHFKQKCLISSAQYICFFLHNINIDPMAQTIPLYMSKQKQRKWWRFYLRYRKVLNLDFVVSYTYLHKNWMHFSLNFFVKQSIITDVPRLPFFVYVCKEEGITFDVISSSFESFSLLVSMTLPTSNIKSTSFLYCRNESKR